MAKTGFSTTQAAHITGVSVRQLNYWRKTDLLKPSLQTRGGHARYQFTDLIAVRAARQLIDAGVPVQRIRKNLAALIRFLPQVDRPLAELSVLATGDTLLVFHSGSAFEALTGQEWILDIAHLQREVERQAGSRGGAVQRDMFNDERDSIEIQTESGRKFA